MAIASKVLSNAVAKQAANKQSTKTAADVNTARFLAARNAQPAMKAAQTQGTPDWMGGGTYDKNGAAIQNRTVGQQIGGALTGGDAISDIQNMRIGSKSGFTAQNYDPGKSDFSVNTGSLQDANNAYLKSTDSMGRGFNTQGAKVVAAQGNMADVNNAGARAVGMQAATLASPDVSAANAWQNKQANLADTLNNRIAGNAPSVAALQLQQGLSQQTAAANAARNSARGASAGLANRNAANALTGAQAATNQAAAQLRAGEQTTAENSLGNVLQQGRAQALDTSGLQNTAATTAAGFQQGANAQTSAQAQQAELANATARQAMLAQNVTNNQAANTATAGYAQQATQANATNSLTAEQNQANARNAYLKTGLDAENAKTQALIDYQKMISGEQTANNAVNAQTANANADRQQKASGGMLSAVGGVIGGIFSDEAVKKDIKSVKTPELKEFLDAITAPKQDETAARQKAATAASVLDARMRSGLGTKDAQKTIGFSGLFAPPAAWQDQPVQQAPVRQSPPKESAPDPELQRAIRLRDAAIVAPLGSQIDTSTVAPVPRSWKGGFHLPGGAVGFDRSKLLPGDLDSEPNVGTGIPQPQRQPIQPAPRSTEEMLSKLDPKSFNYVAPQYGTETGAGVLAQDLEKSKIGRTLVTEDENGTKMLDPRKGFGAVLAAQADLNRRLEALEGKQS